MVDVHFTILLPERNRFVEYEEAICTERARVDETEYRCGRLAGLRSFPAMTKMFRANASRHLEATVQRSLAESIAKLSTWAATRHS